MGGKKHFTKLKRILPYSILLFSISRKKERKKGRKWEKNPYGKGRREPSVISMERKLMLIGFATRIRSTRRPDPLNYNWIGPELRSN